MVYSVAAKDERSLAQAIGVNAFFVKDYLQAAQRFSFTGIEKVILLLHQYNLRSIGVDDAGTEDYLLLKEMVVKMITD